MKLGIRGGDPGAAFDAGHQFRGHGGCLYGNNGALHRRLVGKAEASASVRSRRSAPKWPARWAMAPAIQGLSRKHIMDGVEASLKRLDTDYIDLYQAHRPDLQQHPWKRHYAHSMTWSSRARCATSAAPTTWPGSSPRRAASRTSTASRPGSRCSPPGTSSRALTFSHLLDAGREYGVGIIPFRPIASGVLTGKYQRGQEPEAGTRAAEVPYGRRDLTDRALDVADRFRPFAKKRGKTLVELAIAWLLAHPECSTVIAGAVKPEQVTQRQGLGVGAYSRREGKCSECPGAKGLKVRSN